MSHHQAQSSPPSRALPRGVPTEVSPSTLLTHPSAAVSHEPVVVRRRALAWVEPALSFRAPRSTWRWRASTLRCARGDTYSTYRVPRVASSFKPCGDFFDLLFLVEDERCPVVRVVPDYGPSSGGRRADRRPWGSSRTCVGRLVISSELMRPHTPGHSSPREGIVGHERARAMSRLVRATG